MDWICSLIFFALGLFAWAAIGHGIWMLGRIIFTAASARSCPACQKNLASTDKACRHCGWTSRPVDAKQGLKACRQILIGAVNRHLIDDATMQRASDVLDQLEEQLDGERRSVESVRPISKPAPVPTLPPIPPSTVPLDAGTVSSVPVASAAPSYVADPRPVTATVVSPITASEKSDDTIHALDRDYPIEQVPAPKLTPARSWTQWFSAFMEESNIRWGELVGGLLIVCCSVALVISFWENIASRPWLKFSIFTGINIATFSLGLYAWHRWKLPTTSKGILVIGMMLLPLNFLAFALFTLGMPWDWFTVGGEMISLAILGLLAWQAAQVLTPSCVVVMTVTPIVFAVANLLVRRSVSEGASPSLMYAWGLGLSGLYVAVHGFAWRPLLKRAEGHFAPVLEFLAIATFGVLLAGGLLLRCSETPLESFRLLSPLLSLLAIPALLIAIDISRRIPKGSNLALPMILLGAVAIGLGAASMAFSSPVPVRMIGASVGWLVLVGVAWLHLRHAGFAYPVYLLLSMILVLGWYGFSGELPWTNESARTLIQTVAAPTTGFLWVGWSLVCGAISIALGRLKWEGSSLAALRSAAIIGVVGTIVLSAFGFGREAYANSVGAVYAVYAAACFAIGVVRKKTWVEGMGVAFLAAAAVQSIAFGWSDSHWMVRTFACVASVATVLIVVLMVRKIIGQPADKDSLPSNVAIIFVTMTSLVTLLWFFLAESTQSWNDGPAFAISLGIYATLLWFLFSWVQPDSNFWRITQWAAIVCCVMEIVLRCKSSHWWNDGSNGYLHPMFLQYVALALFLCGAVLVALHEVLRRSGQSSVGSFAGPLPSLHDSSVARYAVATATIMTLGLLAYGATPGTLQELIPRDALASTEITAFTQDGKIVERLIPALNQLELEGIPHAATSWGRNSKEYLLWGLPPIWAVWGIGLAGLGFVGWNARHSDAKLRLMWLGLGITLALALCYPVASQWESSVAVASSIRWLTAGLFFILSLALSFWIQRIDRGQEPYATRSFANFDYVFSTISLSTIVPWMAMIAVVAGSVLTQATFMPWTWWVWSMTGVMGLVALFLVLAQFGVGYSDNHQQPRSVAAITASTMLAAPLVSWMILQIAITVIAHPLTGPNPDSFFGRIGLAGSYAIPILLISVALVSVSAARPSPHLAFISALFLMVTVVVGYMLILKSNGARVEAWIGLAAALSGTASIFSIIWRAYTARDTRSDALLHWSGRPARLVRDEWQTALSQVSAGFVLVGLIAIVGVVVVQPASISGLLWASLGILVATSILLAQRWIRRDLYDYSPWIGAVGIACMGIVASASSSTLSSLGFSSVVMALTGSLMIANSARHSGNASRRANPFAFLIWIIGILGCLSFRVFFDNVFPMGTSVAVDLIPVLIMVAAWALSIANAWLHHDRWSWLVSLLVGQFASSLFTFQYWSTVGPWDRVFSDVMFLQLAALAVSSGLGTALGFSRRVRIPLIFATICLVLLSGLWLAYALPSSSASSLSVFPLGSYAMAIVACLLAGMTGYWSTHSRDENATVYLSGLCGVVCLLQAWIPSSVLLLWVTTVFLAAYCLATSFWWRAGRKMHDEVARLVRLPKPIEKQPATSVVIMNIVLALLVAAMGVAAQFLQENLNIRFTCSQAIMATTFAVGNLARYVTLKARPVQLLDNGDMGESGSVAIRILALALGVLYAVTMFWHIQPIGSTTMLDRIAVATLPLTLIAACYGFGLIKWMGLKQEWEQAAFRILPTIVGMAIVGGLVSVGMEYQLSKSEPGFVFANYPTFSVFVSLILAMVLCISAAMLPGRDPLGLSERGREAYVYAAKFVLILLIIHLRLAFPWLFTGLLQQIWPLLLLAIAFVGLGVAEWAERRGWNVLANPLRNSGGLLPLLPVLAPWLAESRIDYGVTLVTAAVGYGLFGFMKRSPLYITACLMAANGAIWYLLHRNQFSFPRHPQLWVIPPALCVFAAVHFMRHRLNTAQLATARYASLGAIYVASTSEIFLQGIAKAPWLPIVLAVLSVLGILFGIAARIRSMLWLGSMFLCVALFSILWYAAVDLEQTWIWYASGIVLGAIILVVFALFEKRREDLKRLMNNMQQWEE